MSVTVCVIGPEQARRRALDALALGETAPATHWHEVPAGPAVLVDATRFEWLSADGVKAVAAALEAGAPVVVPGSNSGRWPLCGLNPPHGSSSTIDLIEHARQIADVPDDIIDTAGLGLPAVFGVADGRQVHTRPTVLADLGERATLVASAWCHQREVPLLTLSMIVKNEAPRIAHAIECARGVVDEVVVYDTGSDDDTVAIARAAGAAVREGYWDDDFGRARNEGFAMARSEWLLVLDGDDEFVSTPDKCTELRAILQEVNDPSVVITVQLRNLVNTVTGQLDGALTSRRLYRRGWVWRNRIHELAFPPDGAEPNEAHFAGAWIRHTGYVGDQNDRIERNKRIVALRFENVSTEHDQVVASYEKARALVLEGDEVAACVLLREVIAMIGQPTTMEQRRLWASARLLVVLLESKESTLDEQLAMLEPMLANGGVDAAAARWMLLKANQECTDQCLEWIADIDDSIYLPPVTVSRDEVLAVRALLHAKRCEFDRSLADLRRGEGVVEVSQAWIAAGLAVAHGDRRALDALVPRVSADDLPKLTGALAVLPAEAGFVVVSALWRRFGAAPVLVAYLASASYRAGFFTALEARLMLAEADALAVGDPLQCLFDDPDVAPADRVLAALVLDDFDARAESRVAAVASDIDDASLELVVKSVHALLPGCLAAAAAALGTTPPRRAHLDEILTRLLVST
jgi:hypothetical protein